MLLLLRLIALGTNIGEMIKVAALVACSHRSILRGDSTTVSKMPILLTVGTFVARYIGRMVKQTGGAFGMSSNITLFWWFGVCGCNGG